METKRDVVITFKTLIDLTIGGMKFTIQKVDFGFGEIIIKEKEVSGVNVITISKDYVFANGPEEITSIKVSDILMITQDKRVIWDPINKKIRKR